jgi:hypothetical protein
LIANAVAAAANVPAANPKTCTAIIEPGIYITQNSSSF